MKSIPAILIICILLFTACSKEGISANVSVELGESAKFSADELNEAVSCVKEGFKGFEGCELVRLWYDEESADNTIKGYMQNGRGRENGVKEENVIVLFSDFRVDGSGVNKTLNSNSVYKKWNWILIRNDGLDSWRIDDSGY